MSTWFIADLHLSPQRPDISALFAAFLQQLPGQAEALYILGDLVDAWLGDDDDSDFARWLQQQLRQLTESGVAVYLMAGNRDFLIGAQFAAATGVRLLSEPTVITLDGTKVLLLHGDTLCTLDHGYQRFRRIIRARPMQALLRALPLRIRMGIARQLRSRSKTQQALPAALWDRFDAQADAVIALCEQYQVERLIHGHTHRPGRHQHPLHNGRQVERIVLGDWYQQGSLLHYHQQQWQLLTRPLPEAG